MDNTKLQNTGLILKNPRPQDWRFGSISAIADKIIVSDGQWLRFAPTHEKQLSRHFDTMACVTFSALNCLEMLWKQQYGDEMNWSDRYIAKLSDTTRRGNWLYRVADTIRSFGLIPESNYPYPRTQDGFDWDDYYVDISDDLKNLGKVFLNKVEVNYEWVNISNIEDRKKALQRSPLQVTGLYASMQNADENGIIQNRDYRSNHAFVLVGYDDLRYWYILDTYNNQIKKIAWDYNLDMHAIRYSITKKIDMPEKVQIKNNTLVQLVEGEGGFGFYLDGEIIIPTPVTNDLSRGSELDQKIRNLKESIAISNTDRMRNKDQNTIALTQAQWDAFPKVNLKGEQINS